MANETKRAKKQLRASRSKLSEGGTKLVTVVNNGADDKFSIVISVQTLEGTSYSLQIAERLTKGERKEADISGYNLKITRAAFMWRDKNGIGRYTCTKEAQQGRFFLSLLCWWVSPEETVEENFVSGSEIFA